MVGRGAGRGLAGRVAGMGVWLIVCWAAVLTACGGENAGDQAASQAEEQVQSQSGDAPGRSGGGAAREREFTFTSADVGAHLEEKSYEVGLPFWLEASGDETLASLPMRALASSGIFFSPTPESATQETLWLHVFTDAAVDSAVDWVKYAGSQPQALASAIVWHHDLFEIRLAPAPVVGDAAVSLELFHGHSGLCLRSGLLVFAQSGVLVFLFNSVEITSRTDGSQTATSGGGIPRQCEVERAAERLTEIEAIGHLISERLSSDP